jgi:hypothetical protein
MYRYSIGDAMELAAKRIGIQGWQGRAWKRAEGGHIIEGGIPHIKSAGKNKGKPSWNGIVLQTILVMDFELQAAAMSYEQTTGNCWECKGRGRVVTGWSVDTGAKHQSCSRCRGSGKADALAGRALDKEARK